MSSYSANRAVPRSQSHNMHDRHSELVPVEFPGAPFPPPRPSSEPRRHARLRPGNANRVDGSCPHPPIGYRRRGSIRSRPREEALATRDSRSRWITVAREMDGCAPPSLELNDAWFFEGEKDAWLGMQA